MIRRRAAALVGVLGALLLAAAPPAQAADARGRVLQISSAGGSLTLLFAGVGLGATDTIDPASVKVSVNGQSVAATATTVASDTATVKRTAVVAIDTSGSMAGARLVAAKAAAGSFIDSLPRDVSVGLVTFSSTARLDVAPTTDHGRVGIAVSRLVATGNTAMYDAAALSAATAGRAGARTVLLLSDGLDEGSKSTLAQAVASVKASGVLLSAVALGAEAGRAAPLAQIAASSGGTVLKAPNAADLADAFRSAARTISQQVVVRATLPKSFTASSATVAVSATAGRSTITDQVFTSVSRPAPAAAPNAYGPKAVAVGKDGFFTSSSTLYVAGAALFLGVLILLAVAVNATEDTRTGMPRRLSIYTLTGRGQTQVVKESSVLGDSPLARGAMDVAGRVVARRDIESGLELSLDAAGVPLRPAEWLLLHVGIAVGLAFLTFLLTGGDPLATSLALLIGIAAPFAYLRLKQRRRTAAFLEQLPDTLQLLSGSLSAGYSLPQALDTVVREGSAPVSGEFNRALVESRLGVPVEEALDGIGARMKSQDFAWVVMAIRIQRDVGGNLAEVLSTLSNTLRERDRLRRQALVLSAEGRLSAYILGGLPPVFALYLVLVRRTYISALWHDPIGIFMLVTGGVLMVVGAFWLSKVVKVEV